MSAGIDVKPSNTERLENIEDSLDRIERVLRIVLHMAARGVTPLNGQPCTIEALSGIRRSPESMRADEEASRYYREYLQDFKE